jgi:GNAT superfamily N-acetyltransferase
MLRMSAVSIDQLGASEYRDALPLLAAQLDEHAIPIESAALERAVRGLVEVPERGVILVARDANSAVGVAAVSYSWTIERGGKAAWLEELYVLPAWRGNGIGTALLRAAIDAARRFGCSAVDLEVESSHERVEALYERHGFAALRRTHFAAQLTESSVLPAGD